ncbi:MAG: biosynthetic-type acetolactate synthase large subunit [Bacteroidales bacterium]|nr:biosynthetic-type acetolactate synthase large subunit [Bacteroidales bacterium]MDY5032929.1 biosynthetic-type acetolactate synthase large subunit [Prevotella sp.]
MNKITGAEALMLSLKAEGVETIFGYPGGSIMPTYDALYDYTIGEKKSFEHILVRHEQAATHAAEGYARVSGRVGVTLVTSGPGVTNTLTGVADAMMDSTPIVVIAGQVATSVLGSDAFQEVDLVSVSQPITKWAYQIRRAEDIPWAVSRAFFIAKSGRPGPVVLDFTKNAQTQLFEYKPTKVEFIRSYIPSPELDMEAVREAAQLINNAKKPMALVGQGVELGNAQHELKAFLEKADIPAGRTLMGLSALPSNHPLNMGMLGMHGSYAVNLKEQEADVLIAIGMRFSDRVTGNLERYAKQAKIIHLDIDPSEIDKNVKTTVAVVADCKISLPAITALLDDADHTEWKNSFIPLREKEIRNVITPATKPTSGPLLMGEVAHYVAEATDSSAVLVTDVGQNQLMSARYFKFHKSRSIATSGGLGTMGYGLPAAMGATYGAPERTVCCFMGDGGLQMMIQEFGTIMEHQIPVKMILLNNNFLGNVRQWQDMFFHHKRSFTPMCNPDFGLVAKAYDIPYRRVENREDLPSAINEMLATKGPFLLETIIKADANVEPMTAPGQAVDEMMLNVEC